MFPQRRVFPFSDSQELFEKTYSDSIYLPYPMTNRGALFVVTENYVPVGSVWKMKKHLHLS